MIHTQDTTIGGRRQVENGGYGHLEWVRGASILSRHLAHAGAEEIKSSLLSGSHTTMFLRFVTTRVHEDSHKPAGVFGAAYALLDSGALEPYEWKRVREILIWFNKNLPTPPDRFSAKRAIFWFKSSSEESIRHVWELVHALRFHGYQVEVHKCRRLANIVWEEHHQVAAYPSERDGKITVQ